MTYSIAVNDAIIGTVQTPNWDVLEIIMMDGVNDKRISKNIHETLFSFHSTNMQIIKVHWVININHFGSSVKFPQKDWF